MVLKRAFVLSVTVSAILSSVNATTYSELKDFLESSGSNSITLDSDVNSPESTTIVMNSGHKTINAQSYSFNNTYGSSNIRRGIMIQNSASLTINNLNMNGFRQNSAIDFNTSTTLNVNNSNFTNNKHIGSTGLSQGGAITNSGLGTLNISGSNFLNNSASNGGAVYNFGTLNVTNTVFENNESINLGGAVNNGGALSHTVRATIVNSTFKNNEVSGSGALNGRGGGFYSSLGVVSIDNVLFSGNIASQGGGGTSHNAGSVEIKNSKFLNNSVTNGNGGAILFERFTADSGAIRTGTLNISNTTFELNSAEDGGAIANMAGTVNITNSNFTNNTATGLGGAIYVESGAVVNINANGANSTFSGNTANGNSNAIFNSGVVNLSATDGAIVFNDDIYGDGVLNLNSGAIVFNADMSGIFGSVNLNPNAVLSVGANATLFANANFISRGGILDFTNALSDGSVVYGLGDLNLSSTLPVFVSVDTQNQTMTQIEATSVSGTGSVHVQKFALVNNQNFDELTGLIFTEDDALKSKVTHANRAFSGTNQYNISYNNGVFSLIRNGYNPAVQTASVVNSALQTMQTSATNELFSSIGNHFSSNDSNLYASINDEQIFANTQKSNAGVWIRPYYGKEDLKLQDMPKVKSTIYGALIGVDSDLIELGNSFDVGFSVFAGYNGGEQKYDDVKARQNGVVIGAMASFYSGDFFSAFALNGGTIKSKITTSADINGDGSFNSYSFGIANKTGYNFNFANALTLQPSLTLMYSHIKSKDYTNASSVNISSDAVNAFQIAPTLKLIKGFENEFKAYVSAGGVFNTNNKTDVRADGVVLPGSAVKSYGEYTLGVEKRWDRFGGFIQAGYRSGDRKGAIGQFGFKWFFDQKTNSVHKIATVNGKKEVTF